MGKLSKADHQLVGNIQTIRQQYTNRTVSQEDAVSKMGKALMSYALRGGLKSEKIVLILGELLGVSFDKEGLFNGKFSFLDIVQGNLDSLKPIFEAKMDDLYIGLIEKLICQMKVIDPTFPGSFYLAHPNPVIVSPLPFAPSPFSYVAPPPSSTAFMMGAGMGGLTAPSPAVISPPPSPINMLRQVRVQELENRDQAIAAERRRAVTSRQFNNEMADYTAETVQHWNDREEERLQRGRENLHLAELQDALRSGQAQQFESLVAAQANVMARLAALSGARASDDAPNSERTRYGLGTR